MLRSLWVLIAPPLSVCRFGCNSCCVAPISVFWLAGLIAIAYGFLGGPANLASMSWITESLGVLLWLISSAWAGITIYAINRDSGAPECSGQSTTVCRIVPKRQPDESNPLDEVTKFKDVS